MRLIQEIDHGRALIGEAAQAERLLQGEGGGAAIVRQGGTRDIAIERAQGGIELGGEGLLEAVPQPLLAKRLHPVLHLDRHLHGPDRVVAVVRHRPQVAAGAEGIAPRYSRVRTPRACMSRVLNFMHRTYCPLVAPG